MKHSLMHEDIHPSLFVSFDRFFAVEHNLIKDFDEKFNPKSTNPFFGWGSEEIEKIREIMQNPRSEITIEYNLCISQIIISFSLFINKFLNSLDIKNNYI